MAYALNTDHEREVLDEFSLTQILKNVPIIRRPGPSVALSRHMDPLFFSVSPESSDNGYDRFRGLTVTFRFRKVRPRGAEGVRDE